MHANIELPPPGHDDDDDDDDGTVASSQPSPPPLSAQTKVPAPDVHIDDGDDDGGGNGGSNGRHDGRLSAPTRGQCPLAQHDSAYVCKYRDA